MRRPSDSTEGIRTADPAVVSTSTRHMRHGTGGTGARSLTWAYLVALFVVYLLLLGWIVIWKLETPWVGEDRAIDQYKGTGALGRWVRVVATRIALDL